MTIDAHLPVLLDEAVDALCVRRDGLYVDGTFGRGGHSRRIAARLGAQGRLVVIDRDPQAMAAARAWAADMRAARAGGDDVPAIDVAHARFSQMPQVLADLGIEEVDGVLLDLGVSSPQLDDPSRGFSFSADGPLDMRMDPSQGKPVREWLLQASESELIKVLREYGDERFAVPIAKAVVARRGEDGDEAFRTTGQLAELVANVIRRRQKRPEAGKNPATRTFQALRIHANHEIAELAQFLGLIPALLARGGRMAVISFHSLEDRLVKRVIARLSGRDSERHPVTGARVSPIVMLDQGRVLPTAAEASRNPRARSAVLRVAERTDVPASAESIAQRLGDVLLQPVAAC